MLNSSTEKVRHLVAVVTATRKWTQEQLALELGVRPEAISRWLAGSGISKKNLAKLEELAPKESDESIQAEPLRPQQSFQQSLQIPFTIVIPRNSLRLSLDKNGDIRISGIVDTGVNKEESSHE